MITNNIAFDFERITSYLRDYSGKKYEDPKKAGNRMNEMEKFKEAGKKAREEFIAYANYIAESLDYKAGKCKDNACEDLDYKIHNKIIDVPIKKDSKIYYQADLLNGTCRRFDNNTIELEKIKKLKVL